MKTILITGSTDGIGRLTATNLVKKGHRVIVHGRSANKIEKTISNIKTETGEDIFDGIEADFSEIENISKMISYLQNLQTPIDVLINNAGVFKSKIKNNQDGLDIRFVVNFLAPALLTNGLVPLLKKSNSPRVINLSSAAQSSVSVSALKGENIISEEEAYAQSKLALTMWSFAFAKINPEITTIAVNPGSLLNTKMVQEAYGRYWSSIDKGANILVDLAISEVHQENSGKYYDNDIGSFGRAHPDAYNQHKIDALISETKNILNQ